MTINEKDLLQTNVTAIAGILILFTFTSLIPTNQQLQYKGMVAAPAALFAASSIFLIFYNDLSEERRKNTVKYCGYVTIAGFLVLLLTLLILQYSPSPDA
jgi:hypothetical protein